MAGQFCFCGDLRRGVDAGVGEDAGGGLLGGVGGVLFVVDGDAGEQGAVEDASFGWFALVVEVVEVDQEFGELVQACSGLGVGVGEVVEPGGDLVEAGADAVLFAFEDVEWDRVGVVGLDEFEAFGFELVALGGQELAFVLAGSFELVEYVVEDLPDVLRLGLGQGVALVGAFDLGFGAFGEDRGAGAVGGFAASSGAGEVLVAVPGLVAGAFDHELGFAGAIQGAFEVVVVLLWSFAAGVVGVEVGLDAQPGLGVDEGFVGALVGDAAEGDGALVVGVGQDLVQPGGGDWFGRLRGGGSGGRAAGCEFFGQARQGPVSGGVGGEGETDEVGAFGVDLDLAGLASSGTGGADVEVAQRRFGGGAADRGLLGHAFEDFLGQVQRVELGHGGQDAVHEHP